MTRPQKNPSLFFRLRTTKAALLAVSLTLAGIVHRAHSMAVDAMNRTWILSRNTDEDPSVGDASS